MKEKIMKKVIKRRIISVVLTLAMVVVLIPMNSIDVYAANWQEETISGTKFWYDADCVNISDAVVDGESGKEIYCNSCNQSCGTYIIGGGWYDSLTECPHVTRQDPNSKETPYVSVTAASNLTYNGTAQELISFGFTSGGTLWYYAPATGVPYSTSIPTATNAGTYTVYYKVVGDETYEDVAEDSVSVTIAAATPSVTAPTAKTGLVFNNSAQELINAGSTNFGTLQYKLGSDGSYSTSIPTATDAGTYTVYYKVDRDVYWNYTAVAEAHLDVTISEAGGGSTSCEHTWTEWKYAPSVGDEWRYCTKCHINERRAVTSSSTPSEPSKSDVELREAVEEEMIAEPVTIDKTQLNKADAPVVPGTTYNLSNFITSKGIVKGIKTAVANSNKNGSKTVTIYTGTPFCFDREIVKAIQNGKKDVVYYFTYKGHLYSVTVPATVDATKVLEKAGFAGPLYVGQQLGTTRLVK